MTGGLRLRAGGMMAGQGKGAVCPLGPAALTPEDILSRMKGQ